MRRFPQRTWWPLLLLCAACVLAIALPAQLRNPKRHDPTPPLVANAPSKLNPPIPQLTSEFQNTAPSIAYIGSQACGTCHPSQQASFLATSHSRALDEVDPAHEPPDAEFFHTPSRRKYRIYRERRELRHRESITHAGEEIVLNDHAMRYVVGSGNHTRSYLVEDNGFLVESPLTWYASRSSWGMSPGYDEPQHPSFERPVGIGCLVCHAGRAEEIANSTQRLRVHEAHIGCENCHGPGELHAQKRRAGIEFEALRDDTIVHPARLDRERLESICGQCHLRSGATVFVKGRRAADYRPGLPLTHMRIDYALDRPSDEMTVVGHMEQMRASRCYTQSTTLTCTTCHDPHAPPSREEMPALYRAICLECHQPTACGLTEDARRERQPDDSCIACHMPQSDTDIPHIAFTHHRIGIHNAEPAAPPHTGPGQLRAIGDISHLPALEQQRCLALAYLELSDRSQRDPAASQAYLNQATRRLFSLREQGLHDPEVDAALARILWMSDPTQAAAFAEQALAHAQIPAEARANALFVLGDARYQQRDFANAIPPLQTLTNLRRVSEDWVLLGASRLETGKTQAAIPALKRALQISPTRAEIHHMLENIYTRAGDTAHAAEHRRSAAALSTLLNTSK